MGLNEHCKQKARRSSLSTIDAEPIVWEWTSVGIYMARQGDVLEALDSPNVGDVVTDRQFGYAATRGIDLIGSNCIRPRDSQAGGAAEVRVLEKKQKKAKKDDREKGTRESRAAEKYQRRYDKDVERKQRKEGRNDRAKSIETSFTMDSHVIKEKKSKRDDGSPRNKREGEWTRKEKEKDRAYSKAQYDAR